MNDRPDTRLPYCQDYEEIQHQRPTSSYDYKYKDQIENVLELGEYLPFATNRKPSELMFELSGYKYVYKKYNEFQVLIDNIKEYLKTWQDCVNRHRNNQESYCYNNEFRMLMDGSFENIMSILFELNSYTIDDFDDFEKVLDFTRSWNGMQRRIAETFYAHLIEFPKWLDINDAETQERNTCATCNELQAIGPPSMMFIALSACFLPQVVRLPDNTIIPEGILANEGSKPFHILHEHIHAYLHEKKAQGHQHLNCDWIEEGISDWAAMRILEPDIKERSYLMEIYDFWIILNSINDDDRKQIIKLWCYEPEKFGWKEFVSNMRQCIRKHRAKNRQKLVWFRNEQCEILPKIDRYYI